MKSIQSLNKTTYLLDGEEERLDLYHITSSNEKISYERFVAVHNGERVYAISHGPLLDRLKALASELKEINEAYLNCFLSEGPENEEGIDGFQYLLLFVEDLKEPVECDEKFLSAIEKHLENIGCTKRTHPLYWVLTKVREQKRLKQ